MRRDAQGARDDVVRTRYSVGYDTLAHKAAADSRWELTIDYVREVHDAIVGGRAFRTTDVGVGGFRFFAPPRDVERSMAAVIEECNESQEPPPLIATRLHLGIMDAHPFTDGNGRTARLLGTLYLIHAGYRSSLMTALEEVAAVCNLRYVYLLHIYRTGSLTRERCLRGLLQHLAAQSAYAAWFRAREEAMREYLPQVNRRGGPNESTLLNFDFADPATTYTDPSTIILAHQFEPLRIMLKRMSAAERMVLCHQALRLLNEESEDAGQLSANSL
jgi:Fic family protein